MMVQRLFRENAAALSRCKTGRCAVMSTANARWHYSPTALLMLIMLVSRHVLTLLQFACFCCPRFVSSAVIQAPGTPARTGSNWPPPAGMPHGRRVDKLRRSGVKVRLGYLNLLLEVQRPALQHWHGSCALLWLRPARLCAPKQVYQRLS
jgi:hypothetical protein